MISRTVRLGSARLGPAAVAFAWLAACVVSEDETSFRAQGLAEDSGSTDEAQIVEGEQVADSEFEDGASEPAELVYEAVRLVQGGVVLEEQMMGSLGWEEAMRAARPYRHLHEPYVYEEETWRIPVASDTVQTGHRVWRRPNPFPAVDPMTEQENVVGPPIIDSAAQALLDGGADDPAWGEDQKRNVSLLLRGVPEWDVPLRPRTYLEAGAISDDEAAEWSWAREERLKERRATVMELAAPVQEAIEASGGTVDMMGTTAGWLNASVTWEGLVALSERTDLRSIALDEGGLEPGWHLGEGRDDSKVDAGDFIDAGYDGQGPSGGSRIKIAFVEHGKFRNTACAFKNGGNCSGSSRVEKMYNCYEAIPGTNPTEYCELESGLFPHFDDDWHLPLSSPSHPNAEDGNHGTSVVALAAADYEEGQADGYLVGDTTTNHSATWERRASGFAPEASILYFGNALGGDTTRPPKHAEAFWRAVEDGADIISFSQGSGGQQCKPAADLVSEIEAENAYDDGVLVVACTGNYGGGSVECGGASCGTWSVGSLAKTLAVAGYRSQDSACQSSFASCRKDYCQTWAGLICIDDYSACNGGADVKIDGTTYTKGASLTDLLMSTHVGSSTHYGNEDPDDVSARGAVSSGTAGGCSSATPQVAGLAASIKDMHLSTGDSWISNPGRLQTVLLAMADRSYEDVDNGTAPILTRVAGASRLWGFGRLRARYWDAADFGPALLSTWTVSFTQSSGQWATGLGLNLKLPTGTDLVKCVALQVEDFSGYSDPVAISDVDLRLRVRDPVSNSCASGSGTIRYTQSDNSADWKKQTAITSAQTPLDGQCAYVALTPSWVVSRGITVQVACVSSAKLESEG